MGIALGGPDLPNGPISAKEMITHQNTPEYKAHLDAALKAGMEEVKPKKAEGDKEAEAQREEAAAIRYPA